MNWSNAHWGISGENGWSIRTIHCAGIECYWIYRGIDRFGILTFNTVEEAKAFIENEQKKLEAE